MTKRTGNLVNQHMAEVVLFGGLPLTRADVARIMKEDGFDRRAIDLFAFAKKAVKAEPINYDEFRAITADAA